MAVLPANERPSSWGVGGWLPWRTSWAWGWGTAESGPGTASARRFSRWPSRGSLRRSTAMLSGARGGTVTCRAPWWGPRRSRSPPSLPGASRGPARLPRTQAWPPAFRRDLDGVARPAPVPGHSLTHSAPHHGGLCLGASGHLLPPLPLRVPRAGGPCARPQGCREARGCLALVHAQAQSRTARACLVRAWGSWGPVGLARGEADGQEAEARITAFRWHVGTEATGTPNHPWGASSSGHLRGPRCTAATPPGRVPHPCPQHPPRAGPAPAHPCSSAPSRDSGF